MADKALQGAIAVTRFGLGARPGEIEDASRDPVGWLRAQIRPEGADQPVSAPLPPTPSAMPPPKPDPAMAGTEAAALSPPVGRQPRTDFGSGQPLPSMKTAWKTWLTYQDEIRGAKADPELRRQASLPIFELAGEEVLARARLATSTSAGFRERWFLFWANHFTVAAKNQPTTVSVGPFEREAIRPHVFGPFVNLLVASSMHPGMLLYLDQAQSIGPNSTAGMRRGGGLNENLAREIMELHSVGADAGYSQADVTEFARALTGWSIGGRNPRDDREIAGNFIYRDSFHEPGARTVFGRRYVDDGGKQALQVMIDLAGHPSTAKRLCTKIARHFVADDPPAALVQRLEGAWVRTGGDLAQVADALVTAPEALDLRYSKLKTPYEFVISAYRAADFVPTNPAREVVQPLSAMGQRPFGAPQPNGWSDVSADWAAPDAVVKRLTWAQGFANAHTPLLQPVDEARAVLGQRLSPNTQTFISRAESRPEAFALLLMSPEFQRR